MTGPRPVTPLGILAARLGDLVAAAERGEPVDLERLRAAHALAAGLDPYVAGHTTPESPALRALAERTAAHPWTAPLEQEMLSGHVEGRFLALLVHATRARHVLEIGMFTGYSALAIAEALPDGGRVVACEIDPDVAAFARDCFAGSPARTRVEVRVGPALATLAELAAAAESFDLVFVDADKAGYLDYVRHVVDSGLLAPHGLLCVDNTLMQGLPWTAPAASANAAAITAFNAAVAADPRLEQVVVPLRDGVTLIRRA